MTLLVMIVGGFAYFLYVQYNSTEQQQVEEKHIEFKPVPWYSATRNVRMEEYGDQLKPFEIEARYGLSGPPSGSGGTEIY